MWTALDLGLTSVNALVREFFAYEVTPSEKSRKYTLHLSDFLFSSHTFRSGAVPSGEPVFPRSGGTRSCVGHSLGRG